MTHTHTKHNHTQNRKSHPHTNSPRHTLPAPAHEPARDHAALTVPADSNRGRPSTSPRPTHTLPTAAPRAEKGGGTRVGLTLNPPDQLQPRGGGNPRGSGVGYPIPNPN